MSAFQGKAHISWLTKYETPGQINKTSLHHTPPQKLLCLLSGNHNTYSYILWISISAKSGFGLPSHVALVQRHEFYLDRNSLTAWEVWKLIYSLGPG